MKVLTYDFGLKVLQKFFKKKTNTIYFKKVNDD